jgi:hypothetical protein
MKATKPSDCSRKKEIKKFVYMGLPLDKRKGWD